MNFSFNKMSTYVGANINKKTAYMIVERQDGCGHTDDGNRV
jgi:hypothetical protein